MMFDNIVEKDNKLSFDVNDVDLSLVNALRRIIIAEVQSIAFAFDPNVKENDLKVKINTGSLHNEFLCHRISLIPLHFSKEEFENFQSSKYNFVLKKKNTSEQMLKVTTADFEIFDETGRKYPDEFLERILPANKFTNDHILITKLKPNMFDKSKGDEIHIEGQPSIGSGRLHARWTPVSLCTFFNILDDNSVQKGLEEYIKQNRDTSLDEQELRARFNTLEVHRFFKKNKFMEPSSFRFELETECGFECKQIFKMAMNVLIEKLKTFISNLQENNKILVSQSQGMTYITVDNEDHTLGNVVQSMLYNIYIRETDDTELKYIGYYKPHPLEDNVIIKVKTDKDPIKLIQNGCTKIIDIIQDMIVQWNV